MTAIEATPSPATVESTRFGLDERQLAVLAMLGAAAIWGSAAVVTKIALESLSPFVLAVVRWSFAVAVMGLVLRGKGARPVVSRPVALMAIFGMLGFTLFFSFGLQRTTAANTTLIGGGTPMLVALASVLFLGETISRSRGVGIGLSLVGVAVIVGGATLDASLLGNLLVVCSALSWTVYTVIGRTVVAGRNPLAITAGTGVVGLLLFFPLAVWELASFDQGPITPRIVLVTIYLAFGPSLCSYLLYGYALSRLPASKAAVWGNLMPVVGVAAAAVALDEPITRFHLAGGLLVVVGVWLANRRASATH